MHQGLKEDLPDKLRLVLQLLEYLLKGENRFKCNDLVKVLVKDALDLKSGQM